METKHRSYWLLDIAGDAPDQPPLRGELAADVTIIGGGYVGLWTALHIKNLAPTTSVVLLEQDICGGGASGRNGGFVLSYWPKFSSLIKLCGVEEAISICRDSEMAIEEIHSVMSAHGIDVHFKRAPWIWTATSSSQVNSWEPVVQLCNKYNLDVFQRLECREVSRRTGSAVHRAGVIQSTAATVHPARLARGLRKLCLDAGVQIFEHTKMKHFTRHRPSLVQTTHGQVNTTKLILATNAWAAGIPELSRSLVAITSDMIVTEPISDQLEQLGWTGEVCITDSQMMVDYYRVTQDGRIAFGKGGWGIAFGGRIGSHFDRNSQRAQIVKQDFQRYYPTLSSVAITHDWCGPIDRTPTSLPLLGRLASAPSNIFYGVGWSGNGVGPSVLGGKILASLALGRNDRWANHPLVGKSLGSFPPEPLRYIGAHVVRQAVAARERAEMDDRCPSWISVQLSKLAPAGLEDKN